MLIRMVIAVPLEYLHTTVKFFDKHKVAIRSTEMTNGAGTPKTRKYLTSEEHKSVASIKDRGHGRAVQVAREFGVSVGVVRRIWR